MNLNETNLRKNKMTYELPNEVFSIVKSFMISKYRKIPHSKLILNMKEKLYDQRENDYAVENIPCPVRYSEGFFYVWRVALSWFIKTRRSHIKCPCKTTKEIKDCRKRMVEKQGRNLTADGLCSYDKSYINKF